VAAGEGLDSDFADALEQEGYRIELKNDDRIAFDPGDDSDLRRFWLLAAERGVEVRQLGRGLPSLESAVINAIENAHER